MEARPAVHMEDVLAASPCAVVARSAAPKPARSQRAWRWSRHLGTTVALLLRSLRDSFSSMQKNAPHMLGLLVWALCILNASAPAGYDLEVVWRDQHTLWLAAFLLIGLTICLVLREQLRCSGLGESLLAASAFLMWHLGFQAPHSNEGWCIAVLQSSRTKTVEPIAGPHAAVGLMLLDDMLRAILHYVASTPKEAWPFALVNRRVHWLWENNEVWWEACYNRRSWLNLPLHPRLQHVEASTSSSYLLLREAMLWASMFVETLGTMVMLPPHCATPCWVAAPCVASTLLVFSCARWLPQQSDMVLVAMLQLVRNMSRFALYFQAVWTFATAVLLRGSEDQIAVRILELAATLVLYAMVVSHLMAVTTWCRVAAPLYSVPAEDVVAAAPRRGRPLYCDNLGRVEGFQAPTRMFNNEDLGVSLSQICWRDRFALRHCTESLTAREAQLLSSLEALELRIEEAESEGSSFYGTAAACAAAPVHQWQRFWLELPGISRSLWLRSAYVAFGFVLFLKAACHCIWSASGFDADAVVFSDDSPLPSSSSGFGFSVLEVMLWGSLLLQASQGWYSLMARTPLALELTGRHRCCEEEVHRLRQQSVSLHRSLAETQWTIYRLEAQLQNLGVAVQRPHGHPGECRSWGAMRVLMLSWLSSIVALWMVKHLH